MKCIYMYGCIYIDINVHKSIYREHRIDKPEKGCMLLNHWSNREILYIHRYIYICICIYIYI
jgi:hypothetical protein